MLPKFDLFKKQQKTQSDREFILITNHRGIVFAIPPYSRTNIWRTGLQKSYGCKVGNIFFFRLDGYKFFYTSNHGRQFDGRVIFENVTHSWTNIQWKVSSIVQILYWSSSKKPSSLSCSSFQNCYKMWTVSIRKFCKRYIKSGFF